MKNAKGQSFLELMAALAVVGIVLIVLVSLITKSIANSTYARNKTLATSLSSEALEWLRSERNTGWSSFYSRTGQDWCILSLSWGGSSHSGACGTNETIPNTIFRREIDFERGADPRVVNATVKVIWTDGLGSHESSSTTTFTNWQGN